MRKQRARSGEQRAGAKAERVDIGCSYRTSFKTLVTKLVLVSIHL